MKYSGVVFVTCYAVALGAASGQTLPIQHVEQVHVAFGATPDIATVQWVTMDSPCVTKSDVWYGKTPTKLDMKNSGYNISFTDQGSDKRKATYHVASMISLEASTRYYYKVGDELSGISTVFSFKTAPDASTLAASFPLRFAVYGDQGDFNGQTITHIGAEAQQRTIDMVLHVGDFAYNLDSNQGINGDNWFRDVEPVAANVPYMVDPGNHESAQNFNHYTMRFQNMPSNSGTLTFPEFGERANNWYYSFNVGNAHFLGISTEIYFDYPDMVQAQWEWVQKDLQAANSNRSAAPWIIVHGHRPLYCSCDGDCDSAATLVRMGPQDSNGDFQFGMETLFYKYGVDLYIAGHEHDYERMYDVAPKWNPVVPWLSGKTTQSTVNPPATTHIITGSAGNVENHEPFTRIAPHRTAMRSNTYGYSRMHIYNDTHLHWQQVMCDNGQPLEDEGKIIDDTWIVIENHGPFGAGIPVSSLRKLGPQNEEREWTSAKTHDVVKDGTSQLKVPWSRSAPAPSSHQSNVKGHWSYSKDIAVVRAELAKNKNGTQDDVLFIDFVDIQGVEGVKLLNGDRRPGNQKPKHFAVKHAGIPQAANGSHVDVPGVNAMATPSIKGMKEVSVDHNQRVKEGTKDIAVGREELTKIENGTQNEMVFMNFVDIQGIEGVKLLNGDRQPVNKTTEDFAVKHAEIPQAANGSANDVLHVNMIGIYGMLGEIEELSEDRRPVAQNAVA